eukprot:4138165-Lingulodinium_polyedra.AAC.1
MFGFAAISNGQQVLLFLSGMARLSAVNDCPWHDLLVSSCSPFACALEAASPALKRRLQQAGLDTAGALDGMVDAEGDAEAQELAHDLSVSDPGDV